MTIDERTALSAELGRLFDKYGNCPALGDPYREPKTATYSVIFDEKAMFAGR